MDLDKINEKTANALSIIFGVCLTVILIGMTVRFLMWLFS